MRVLTPLLLLVGCRVPSVESFTGLVLPPRATQIQAYPTSVLPTTSSVVRQRHRCAAVMMAKPETQAALAKGTQIDPAVVEAALVEEDKNV